MKKHWLPEVIKRVDLTQNFFAHPVAKLVWVLSTIALTAVVVTAMAQWTTKSPPTAYDIIGIGLLTAFGYPPLLRAIMIITSGRILLGSKRSVITYAPGGWLVAVLRFVFTKRAFDNIFSQVLIDGREEYWEALSRGDKLLARWRRVQLYLSLAIATVSWIGVSSVKKVIQMWKAAG